MKFPPHFNTKIDMTKVHLPSFKKWINNQVMDILKFEDDIVCDFIYGLLSVSVLFFFFFIFLDQ